MKKTLLIFSAAALLAACQNPEGKKAETSEAGEVGEAVGNEWSVDTAASIVQWHGRKVTGSHKGTVRISSGSLFVEEGKLAGGNFTIDLTSIANEDLSDPEYKTKLEGHLKSDDFFAVEQFPESTFEIIEVQDLGNDSVQVAGNLQIRDVTKKITFDAAMAALTEDRAELNADFNINRHDWNVSFPGKPDDLIADEINFKIALVAAAE